MMNFLAMSECENGRSFAQMRTFLLPQPQTLQAPPIVIFLMFIGVPTRTSLLRLPPILRSPSSVRVITPYAMAPKRKSTDAAAAPAADSPAADGKTVTKKAKSGASKLAIGDNVSSVTATLLTNEEKEVTLAELTKDKGLVIFMYPKANTGGCTKQACGFRDNYGDIVDAGFEVYGMSFDNPKPQTNWKTKYSLPYSLLTDKEGTALKAFGAFKQPRNVIRSHVVIAKGGEMLDIRNQISPGDSFAEAVEFCKKNKQE